jgi:hypothetical protein
VRVDRAELFLLAARARHFTSKIACQDYKGYITVLVQQIKRFVRKQLHHIS